MPHYVGDRIPVRAGDVQPGDRLVDQDGPHGWIEVEEVARRSDGLMLRFTTGDEEPYGPGDLLFRVAS